MASGASLPPPASRSLHLPSLGRSATNVAERHFLALAPLPAFLLVLAVTAIPLALGLGLSFTDFTLAHPNDWHFIGLANYAALISDPLVPPIVEVTIVIVVLLVGVETVFGLAVALLLARKFRFQTLVRLAYVMPLMTAGIVVAVTWRALFDISSGWVDWFLSLFGIAPVDWLSDPSHAIVAIVISDAWVGVPFMAILLLAGLLAVPREPVEAAMVDGATSFQLFRYVTLPAIAPVVEIAVIFRTIDAFRKFELIQVLTGGGPGVSTTTLNYQIYQLTFNEGRLGYGAAMAVLLVGLIVLFVGIVTIFRIRRARGA